MLNERRTANDDLQRPTVIGRLGVHYSTYAVRFKRRKIQLCVFLCMLELVFIRLGR